MSEQQDNSTTRERLENLLKENKGTFHLFQHEFMNTTYQIMIGMSDDECIITITDRKGERICNGALYDYGIYVYGTFSEGLWMEGKLYYQNLHYIKPTTTGNE